MADQATSYHVHFSDVLGGFNGKLGLVHKFNHGIPRYNHILLTICGSHVIILRTFSVPCLIFSTFSGPIKISVPRLFPSVYLVTATC